MASDTRSADRQPSLRRLIRNAWNAVHTIYYANSYSWRVLKSGALFFFGFFLWAGANAVYSFQPQWWFLRYVMAYGVVLIPYGPFQHLVVVPASISLRKRGGRATQVGRHLPNASLVAFLVLVVALGTFPVGPVTADLGSSLGDASADIDPDLQCTKHTAANGTATIHCHLTESTGIDRVVVASGQERLAVDREPPFEFTIRSDSLRESTGQPRFRVDLRDADGDLIRRYTRTVGMIPESD